MSDCMKSYFYIFMLDKMNPETMLCYLRMISLEGNEGVTTFELENYGQETSLAYFLFFTHNFSNLKQKKSHDCSFPNIHLDRMTTRAISPEKGKY